MSVTPLFKSDAPAMPSSPVSLSAAQVAPMANAKRSQAAFNQRIATLMKVHKERLDMLIKHQQTQVELFNARMTQQQQLADEAMASMTDAIGQCQTAIESLQQKQVEFDGRLTLIERHVDDTNALVKRVAKQLESFEVMRTLLLSELPEAEQKAAYWTMRTKQLQQLDRRMKTSIRIQADGISDLAALDGA